MQLCRVDSNPTRCPHTAFWVRIGKRADYLRHCRRCGRSWWSVRDGDESSAYKTRWIGTDVLLKQHPRCRDGIICVPFIAARLHVQTSQNAALLQDGRVHQRDPPQEQCYLQAASPPPSGPARPGTPGSGPSGPRTRFRSFF